MQTPEEIAELKKAYENGAVIEYRRNDCVTDIWEINPFPLWSESFTYRIKPTVTNIKLKTPVERRFIDEPSANLPHSHYFKDVSKLQKIDIYRVLDLYNVTESAIAHAAKKILVSGGRGSKDQYKDIREAIDSLERWCDMYIEDKQNE
jgi:hypothetical protein